MKTVSISDLKAHLSRYLREVQRGNEVQVVDRRRPVARIVGLRSAEGQDRERRDRLIRAGVLRAGSGDASALSRKRPLSIEGLRLLSALNEERGDRA